MALTKSLALNLSREFDIITCDVIAECKNIDWAQKIGKAADGLQSQIAQQAAVAREINREFRLFSKQELPINWKNWFDKHGIQIIIGI